MVVGAIAKGAYVFTEPTNGWASEPSMTQTATLTASDGTVVGFGRKVSIDESGSTVVVGAEGAMVGGIANQGAAYVFTEPSNGWATMTQTAKLTVSGTQLFGLSVANCLADNVNTVVVTAYSTAGTKKTAGPAAAFVFTESNSVWTQKAELTASDPNADFRHSAYRFPSAATRWWSAARSKPRSMAGCGFRVRGTRLRLGEHDPTDHRAYRPGWRERQQFGQSVSISGNMVVVGDSPAGNFHEGAAYVFTGAGSVWTQTARLTGSDVAGDTGGTVPTTSFLSAVSTGGYTVVAGTPVADTRATRMRSTCSGRCLWRSQPYPRQNCPERTGQG